MYGYPVQTRATIQQVAQEVYEMSIQGNRDDLDQEEQGRDRIVLREPNTTPNAKRIASPHQPTMSDEKGHEHSTISDGALNMRAVLIHVAGDALGCIGVIISGLIIWLTHSKHRFYADPALSVAIVILIMCSALHLGMLICIPDPTLADNAQFVRLLSYFYRVFPPLSIFRAFER
jgi:solute carrier family 30 (zinc transporter), member 1